tara:strand:- start:286 stop:444 length:159 start_codon:yes stop_codon:yes gene_type:complete
LNGQADYILKLKEFIDRNLILNYFDASTEMHGEEINVKLIGCTCNGKSPDTT